MGSGSGEIAKSLLDRFAALRQHQRNGQRSPHKPLLVLLALGRSPGPGRACCPGRLLSLRWPTLSVSSGRHRGRAARRARHTRSPGYVPTGCGCWTGWADGPRGPLAGRDVTGRFERVEAALRADPALAGSVARMLVLSNFPETVASDVVEAAGLDPQMRAGSPDAGSWKAGAAGRRRDARWRSAVLQAWDRQCAFCGYDGQRAGDAVGLDAAHVRWFAFGGPDRKGLALCILHHKLFDLGVLGLDAGLRVQVSAAFTARTIAGRALSELIPPAAGAAAGHAGPGH